MPLRTDGETQFVGRVAELQDLEAGLRNTAKEHGRLHLLVGEPGIGKTRLAEKLSQRARSRGFEVLAGRCVEDAGTPPYWPWAQAVEPHLESLKPKELAAVLKGAGSVIALALPAVGRLVPGMEPFSAAAAKPEELRFHVLQAVAGLLARLSQRTPLLVVLDDLHWADEGTLKLLVTVVQSLRESHLMLLGTYRDTDLDRKHPLAEILGELGRERDVHRSRLGGLSRAEVGEYCSAALPGADADAAESVHAATDGNPLFVMHVVREMAHRGANGRADAPLRLPEGVREAIGRRLSRLSGLCNRMLGVASAMGMEFQLAPLKEAAEIGAASELLGALDEACRSGILSQLPEHPGRFRFTHALVRETLRAELPLGERVRVHARVAAALEAAYGEEAPLHAAELAFHFEQAEPVLGPDRAAHYAHLASRQALAAFAFGDALRYAERGVEILKSSAVDDRLAALWLAQADALARTPRWAEAPAVYCRAFEYYRAAGSTAAAVGITTRRIAWGDGGIREICREALTLVPEGSLEAGRIMARLSLYLAYGSRQEAEGLELLNKALVVARTHGDEKLELDVLDAWAWVDGMYHRPDEAEAKHRRLLEIAARQNDLFMEFFLRRSLLDASARVGRLGEAQEHLRAMYRIAERLGDPRMVGIARLYESVWAVRAGDWERGRRIAELVLRSYPDWHMAIHARAEADYQTGRPAEGRQYLEQSVAVARSQPRAASQEAAATVVWIGRAAYHSGDLGLAPEARALGQALLADSPNPTLDAWMRTGLGYFAVLEGNVAEAREQYERKIALRGKAADFFDADILGLLARTFGDYDKALGHFRYAHDHMAHERPRYGWVCLELGKTLLASGRAGTAGEARALLEESLGIARELGMPTLEERVGRALEELGAAKEARTPASPAGLSPREVQVLRLLAKGRTNKEIGFELGISEKTVMNHVTNIYDKTGAGNRVEAASFAARHGLVEG